MTTKKKVTVVYDVASDKVAKFMQSLGTVGGMFKESSLVEKYVTTISIHPDEQPTLPTPSTTLSPGVSLAKSQPVKPAEPATVIDRVEKPEAVAEAEPEDKDRPPQVVFIHLRRKKRITDVIGTMTVHLSGRGKTSDGPVGRKKSWARETGGMTMCIIPELDSIGIAVCSVKDAYRRDAGMGIAFKRALRAEKEGAELWTKEGNLFVLAPHIETFGIKVQGPMHKFLPWVVSQEVWKLLPARGKPAARRKARRSERKALAKSRAEANAAPTTGNGKTQENKVQTSATPPPTPVTAPVTGVQA